MDRSPVDSMATGLILFLMLIPVSGMAVASNATTETMEFYTKIALPATTEEPSVVPDIVVTIAFISGCAIMGVLISKAADIIYDKYINRRSKDTNRSEAARKLLRARVAIMRMKPDPKTPDGKIAKKAAATWMSRAVGRKETVAVDIEATTKADHLNVPGITVTSGNDNDPDGRNVKTPVLPLAIKSKEETTPSQITGEQTTLHTEKVDDVHPIERINIKIKPGGPLPPVAVHDMPKLPTL